MEYITNSILTGYAEDEEVKAIVDKYDIYIFPIANPDGKFNISRLFLSILR